MRLPRVTDIQSSNPTVSWRRRLIQSKDNNRGDEEAAPPAHDGNNIMKIVTVSLHLDLLTQNIERLNF